MKMFISAMATVLLLVTISCAHVKPTEQTKKTEPAKEHIVVRAWKVMNPGYKSEWSPWKKFVYWVGPGH